MTRRFSGGSHLLEVGTLARVEGEGGLRVVVLDGEVTLVELRIFEPPRYFEAFLRGRTAAELPDLTARICGICPVAYQTSACVAIEDAGQVALPAELRQLRRLLYCGEVIESHALHIHLLHAPDFFGYPGAIELAADHRAVVERGLRMKKTGNALMSLIGGRSVHPTNVRIGGFYALPDPAELAALRAPLARGLDDALRTVEFAAGLPFPDLERPYHYLALRGSDGYPLESGTEIVTSGGERFGVSGFAQRIQEEHLARSTALHWRLGGSTRYLTGPLARYALCGDQLSPLAAEAARAAGLGPACDNPFRSIVVRAVEVVYAFDEALRIIGTWSGAAAPAVPVPGVPAEGHGASEGHGAAGEQTGGEGHGASEAPRGLLYHRYRLAADGTVLSARIVPPTAQNLATMEEDLRAHVSTRLDLPSEELTRQCEQVIRNHDPCISCATHALDLRIERW